MTAKDASKLRQRRLVEQTDVDPRPILKRLEREPVVVVENGKCKQQSTLEAMVRQQWAAAMKGDARALRQIIAWAKEFLQLPQSNTIPIVIVPNDYHYPESKP